MFNNPYLMIDNLSLNTIMNRSELIKSIDSVQPVIEEDI